MCGIAGYFSRQAASEAAVTGVLQPMARAMLHRGPDSEGYWVDTSGRLGLAHRRLSIQDLSPLGHQPMASPSARYTMVFNGEVYNFNHLRAELLELGFSFKGHSDTEVMLAAFEAWGIEQALPRFSGMFAIAVHDADLNRLVLARDRLGEKPLYFGWQGEAFLFGSELKALSRHPAWNATVSREALALYLRHNFVPAPYSIFEGIQKLLPGHYLALDFTSGRTEQHAYWSQLERFLAAPDSPCRDATEVSEQLDVLLRQSIRDQLVSDVPVGAFLSGGVDSSTIVALMQELSSQPVKTFTIGFNQPGYNEAEFAKAVAAHLGTDHTEMYLSPEEVLEAIPQLPAIYDEPFADSSQVPTYLVARLARQRVTVALSGDGGDELFGGYSRYPQVLSGWRNQRAPLKGRVAGALARPAGALLGGVIPGLAERLERRAAGWSARTLQDYYREYIAYWNCPSVLLGEVGDPRYALHDGHAASMAGEGSLRDLMYLDAACYMPDDILVKVDRAAMAVSLETRVPLLDHRIVEFAASLPEKFLIGPDGAKQPLRSLLYRHVPRSLIDRPKQGFAVPIATWLRRELHNWAADLLLDATRVGRWFDADVVSRLWNEHQRGEDWSFQLWGLLMFLEWERHFSGGRRA